jgi:hypothetical protein
MAYAESTSVPVERSRAEIERLLQRHKCAKFMAGVDNEAHRATVQFQAHNRIIRFEIMLPDPKDPQYRKMKHRYAQRTDAGVRQLVEQAERSRWRALLLVIKAKLEAVESNIATFEEEFMAHIVLPNNQTVGQWVLPEVARIYDSGRMPTNRQIADASTTVEAEP